jgi:hypothetical protein
MQNYKNLLINQRCSRKKGTFEKLGAWTLPRAPPSYATDWVENKCVQEKAKIICEGQKAEEWTTIAYTVLK